MFALDPPRNAFPSLHVALATVIALAIGGSLPRGRFASRRTSWTAFAWLAGVIASVLLVRQHFAADALAGLALGALVYRVGVGGEGEPDMTGAFEKRGALSLALVVLVFYATLFSVYLYSGGDVPRPLVAH